MAAKATAIIQSASAAMPAAKKLLLEPSNILVLAGARAVSPYNGFESLSDAEQKKLAALLAEHSIAIFNEITPYDDVDFTSFSLVNQSEIKKLDQKYAILKNKIKPPIGFQRQDLVEWFFMFERSLANMIDQELLPKSWDNAWFPHNLRFGMLLGYPGVAISSMLWDGDIPDSATEILVAENGDDFPSVSFFVSKTLAEEAEVVKVSLLWKSIIDSVRRELH